MALPKAVGGLPSGNGGPCASPESLMAERGDAYGVSHGIDRAMFSLFHGRVHIWQKRKEVSRRTKGLTSLKFVN